MGRRGLWCDGDGFLEATFWIRRKEIRVVESESCMLQLLFRGLVRGEHLLHWKQGGRRYLRR